MRIALSIIFVLLVLLLVTCAIFAFRSKKPIGKSVGILMFALIPPVLGNLFIISSVYEIISTIGCYIYFIGMNLVMAAMIRFTNDYCSIEKNKTNLIVKWVLYGLLIADSISLLLNIFLGHAFGIEQIEAYGSIYYRFIPYVGQTIHRVVDYGILAGIFILFIIKLIRSPKVSSERYLVILLAMTAVAAWQTFYIFSRTPVDFSMTGFGVFGLLIFLLALYYRPLRLLDRLLASLASRMPEAIFFFDTNGLCIWGNKKALELFKISNDELVKVPELLDKKFGAPDKNKLEWTNNYTIGHGEKTQYYNIERRVVKDDKDRVVGSYVSIRDISVEQKKLERETYIASHDALTNVLNRAGFDEVMKTIDVSKCFLLLIDFDSFKEANDKYGHKTGDKVLVRMTEIFQKNFKPDDKICRIGGDEFAVIVVNANEKTAKMIELSIDQINRELKSENEKLPLCSISSGGAYGKDAENGYELFNNADHALYETKFNGKCGFTLFKKR